MEQAPHQTTSKKKLYAILAVVCAFVLAFGGVWAFRHFQSEPPPAAEPVVAEPVAPELPPDPFVVWQQALTAHLAQNRSYPAGARERGEEGVVTLHFTVDRNGNVVAAQIEGSSKFWELDREAVNMLQRAQPLPPFPPEMTEPQIDLIVPIRFSLQ